MTTATFVPGDVLDYTPADGSSCREGIAIVREQPLPARTTYAVDTFGGIDRPGFGAHVLTDAELSTATVSFNLADFDRIDRNHYPLFGDYAESDRRTITEQRGYRVRYYLRRGAQPDLATKIANALRELDNAHGGVASAQRRLERALRALADLKAPING